MKVVPSAATELVKELEKLATPLLAAIATARRLPEIAVPEGEDTRTGAALFSMAHGFFKANRGAVDKTEKFARSLATLEASMQEMAASRFLSRRAGS